MTSPEHNRIRRAAIDAGEREAIAGIPRWILDRMEEAKREFVKAGGCKGCGSQILGVHEGHCTTGEHDLY
jgi:hypothetical protein